MGVNLSGEGTSSLNLQPEDGTLEKEGVPKGPSVPISHSRGPSDGRKHACPSPGQPVLMSDTSKAKTFQAGGV